MPELLLPEMTLRAAAVVPPMVLLLAPMRIWMPSVWLATFGVPAALRPM